MKLGKLVDFNPVTKVRRGVQVPFIDMATLPTNGKYISKTSNRLFSGSGAKFTNGDTLVARITPCLENGKGAYVSELEENGFGSTEFIVLRAKNNSDNQFIYYLTRWSKFREYAIQGMSGTSGRQRVSWQTLSDFEFATINKQNRFLIGEVLSRLDDKIEFNRQMNETLEQMAQAVFQDWFVDFGPVKRKLKGINDPVVILGGLITDPAKAQEIANLFPDQFADDGLPEGWVQSKLGHEFNVTMGQSPPGSTYNEINEGLPFFQGRRDFGFRFPKNRVYCNKPSRIAEKDWTLVSVRAPVGDINRSHEKSCIGRGVSTLIHKSGLASYTYYYALALRRVFENYNSNGTVFGSINKKQLEDITILAPNLSIVQTFDDLITGVDQLILNNTDQNHTLAEMRDLLLPKLMSGEISVDELEKKMGGVL